MEWAYGNVVLLVQGNLVSHWGMTASESLAGSPKEAVLEQRSISGIQGGLSVECGSEGLLIERVEIDDSLMENLNRPGYPPPEVVPQRPGHRFLFVLVKAVFPGGDSWDLAAFRLEDSRHTRHRLVAFDFGDQPSRGLMYLVSKGALGIWNDERELARHLVVVGTVVDANGHNIEPVPQCVRFPVGGWPGGAAKLWLAFEVPVSAQSFVLLRQ